MIGGRRFWQRKPKSEPPATSGMCECKHASCFHLDTAGGCYERVLLRESDEQSVWGICACMKFVPAVPDPEVLELERLLQL